MYRLLDYSSHKSTTNDSIEFQINPLTIIKYNNNKNKNKNKT
jgi:hypothetical protein